MTLWLRPDYVFDGECLYQGMILRIEDGRVLPDVPPRGAELREIAGTVSPGFVDLQVNGGGGVMVNTTPTAEGLRAIAEAHRRLGTAAILPTVITDAPGVIERAAEAALAVRDDPGLLGLHIEGPHISVPRRGTHDARFIRPFEPATLAAVRRLRAAGCGVMITVAPEVVGPQDIAALASTGAVVSLGHSDADAETAEAAIAAGAGTFTHLFNAMSQMQGRAPGVTGTAINSTLPVGFICDGIHVDDTMLALAIRARPEPDRMVLVSDAMPTVGGPDRFTLYGREIHVDVAGRLVNAEGHLAGAHVTMAQGVTRLIAGLGIAPQAALRMAVTNPARVIGRPDLAALEGRPTGQVVLLDDDWSFRGTLDSLI